MSSTNTTTPADIDAVLAGLILIRREHKLPRPAGYGLSYPTPEYGSHYVEVKLASLGDVTAWADTLGVAERDRRSHFYGDGKEIHSADTILRGWKLTFRASLSPGSERETAGLAAETVAALEAVVA